MSMIKWVIGTSTQYHALDHKDQNSLYFLTDTQEIFKGDKSYTQATELVERFPSKGAQGRIYIDQTTLEGKVWVNNDWKTVIQPVAESLSDDVVEKKAVSGQAIKAYVTEKVTAAVTDKFVEGITFNKDSKELEYTIGENTTKVGIEGFVTGADYDGTSGKLSFTVQGGKTIDINLPKENFVQSGEYNKVSKEIILTLVDGSQVKIPAGDLVDINEFESTNTVDLAADNHGVVKANVKISQTKDNQIIANGDGLYVAPTDLSEKLDKVTNDRADEIIIAKADGSVKVSGLKAGTSRISGSDEHVLATEAAVVAIRTSLEESIATKFDKSKITQTVLGAEQASEEKVASEKAVATAIDALKDAKIDKSNIIGTISESSKSTEKVASEAAVVAALSWSTL